MGGTPLQERLQITSCVLNACSLLKLLFPFYGDNSRYHVAVLRLVQVPPYACAVINELVSVTDKVVREVVPMIE